MVGKSIFIEGRCYSREEINRNLGGGSVQAYLITIHGRVVAGCFNPDYNPDAPEVVLPGIGKMIERNAELAVMQQAVYHAFLKRGNRAYEYRGLYQVYALQRDTSGFQRGPDHNDVPISGVLLSRKVGRVPST